MAHTPPPTPTHHHHHPLPLPLTLLLLLAAASAAPCTRVQSPPNAQTIDVCAGPYPRTPTTEPTTATIVTINLALSSGTAGLTAAAATVNGAGVLDSFIDVGGGAYTLSYVTQAGDELWPWEGLHVRLQLHASGLFADVETTVVPGVTWSEESGGRGLEALGNAEDRGLCMGDMDGDGDVDIFQSVHTASITSKLWLNDGAGVFSDVAEAWGVATPDLVHGCAFGDADGDGLLDLFIARFSGDVNELHMNTGAGSLKEEGFTRGVSAGSNSLGPVWGDVDGDGDLDLVVCSSQSSANLLFINAGAGTFSNAAAARGLTATRSSYQALLLDIDGDSDLDLLVVNNGGHANELYVNDGAGDFSEESAARGFDNDDSAEAAAAGDWNADGSTDVYVANYDGLDVLCFNDGGGVFTPSTVAGTGGQSRSVASFDFELDGDIDIVVSVSSGADFALLNSSGGEFADARAVLLLGAVAASAGVPAGDIDGDGDVDVAMGISGALYVNHAAHPSAPRSVTLRPLTPAGAPSAFGATIHLECVLNCAAPWRGLRLTDGGGYYAQPAYDAVFGVPYPSASYNATIRWPGDAHPPANWTTHPRLGGIIPSTLLSPAARTFIVRHSPVAFSFTALPWDTPGVAARSGLGSAPPAPGATHTIQVVVSGTPARDLSPVTAVVNGQNVAGSWSTALELVYVTEAGGEDWPWAGLHIEVVLEDSGGLLSTASSSVVVGSTWSEEADARGMSLFGGGGGVVEGVCMGDFDNDGDTDVFVATSASLSQLWVNDGSGGFANQSVPLDVAGSASVGILGCGFGDADGDGLMDLMLSTGNGFPDELHMNTGGEFVEDGGARGVAAGGSGSGLSWGDVDGDGDVDLFVCKTSGLNHLYMNDGSGVFADDATGRGVQGDSPAAELQSALVDVDGDTFLDLLVVQTADGFTNKLYVNDGSGAFTDASSTNGFDASVAAWGVAVGDWSGDGTVGAYVTVRDARDLLYLNDGSGSFTEVGQSAGVGGSTGFNRGAKFFDFQLDGDVDLGVGVWSGTGVAWLNSGGSFVDAASELVLGNVDGCTAFLAGDLDGDGDEDVLAGRCGGVYINHNARPAFSRSVTLRPLTPAGAPSAFGATIRLECVLNCAAPWRGLRVADGGSGYWSQSAYDAVFGVPYPSASYNATIRWPGGAHPPANWTTHPRLGGIVPSAFATPEDGLFVVRQAPANVSIEVLPWDYPGVGARSGQAAAGPVADDTHTISVLGVRDVSAVEYAVANGQDVSGMWVRGKGGISLVYETEEGGEGWPWGTLHVEVVIIDSGGLLSTASFSAVVGSTWSEEGTSRGLTGLSNAQSLGVCMGDVDNDGDTDVFMALPGAANQLFINDGTGVFSEEASAWNAASAGSESMGCAFGDADGDGLMDIMVTLWTGGGDELFMNTGSNFTEDGVARNVAAASEARGLSWGDVDGDGDVDLFVCVTRSSNLLYINDGTGVFSDEAADRGAAGDASSWTRQSALVDVDGDAFLDLLVVQDRVAFTNQLLVNDGSGAFTDASSTNGFDASVAGQGIAVGDWSGDGTVGAYVTVRDARDLLYLNDGSGSFTEVGQSAGVGGSTGDSWGVAAFDVQLDGDVDLGVAVQPSGTAMLWLNSGGSFVDAASDVLLHGCTAFLAGDLDGDGDEDVLAGRCGGVYINHNARPAFSRSVTLRPLTPAGAPSAFGATIRLECVLNCAAPWRGLHIADGGSGYRSQPAYDAVFGVPYPSASYNATIRWPGGAHPPANWTTHPRLGGIVPSAFATPEDGLFVVRQAPANVSIEVLPWDYPGVGARSGQAAAGPVADDTHTISVLGVRDVSAVEYAVANGQDVSGMWVRGKGGVSLVYETEEGGEGWPWGTLHVEVVIIDSGGLLSTASFSAVVGSTWSEEGTSRGLTDTDGLGVCLSDIDNDGDSDIFVATVIDDQNILWVNDGTGVFSEEAATRGVQGISHYWHVGCGFADVDSDGDVDLMVSVWGGERDVLFINDGDGVFDEQAAARRVDALGQGVGLTWGDVDGDGDLDAYLFKEDTANHLYINDGTGVFDDESEARGVGLATVVTRQAVLIDVDGDSHLDLVTAQNQPGVASNQLFINDGRGYFADASSTHGFDASVASEGIVFADVNNDAAVDLYVTVRLGQDLLYLNDGSGFFLEVGGVTAPASDSFCAVTIDLQLDGWADIVVGTGPQAGLTWVNTGGGLGFVESTAVLGLGTGECAFVGATAGDVDGDGDQDLIMTGCGTELFVNHNARLGSARSVVIRPLTPAGAPSVFGAAIRLECVLNCAAPWRGLRLTDGGSGHRSQPAYDAVFGVPYPSASYNATIRWPGGAHPPANWTTHPRLGGIIPSTTLTPADRLVLVRPAPAPLVLAQPLPWDYPGVTTRLGAAVAPPAPDDTVVVSIATPTPSSDLVVTAATVNGQNVLPTLAGGAEGYTLLYTTVAGQTSWPWDGLRVEVATVDGGGLESSLSSVVVPGATMQDMSGVSALATMAGPVALCMADLDGDGDSDVIAVVHEGVNQVFLNDGGGVFVEATPHDLAGAADDGVIACAVGDADGDGRLDVFFSTASDSRVTAHQLYVQQAGGGFQEDGASRGFAGSLVTGRGATWGDVDGDGDVDLFVCAAQALNQLFVNNGTGFFVDEAGPRGVGSAGLSVQSAMLDFDADSDLDIVVVTFQGSGQLFVNDGGGGFAERGAGLGFTQSGTGVAVAPGDLNGDGWLDLFVARSDAAAQVFMNAGGSFVEDGSGGTGLASPTRASQRVALFDVNNDGALDALFAEGAALMVNSGGGLFVDRLQDFGLPAAVSVGTSSPFTIGDIDGDGDVDVVGGGTLFRNHASSGGAPHWVAVRPLTAAGAPSAFGATVRLVCVVGCEAEPWGAVRVIDGGSGRYGQGAHGAHFGLPAWGATFDVEVVFPGGAGHNKATDGRLGGVPPGSVVEVVDRPYLEGVEVVPVHGRGVVGVNDSIVVVLTAGRGRTDLVPGPGCCFVNGVQVVESFAGGGDGSYNLTYVVGEGEGGWGGGQLSVVPTLMSVGRGLAMVEVEYEVGASPAGDPVSPTIRFDCRPGTASANVVEEVCVSCPGEALCGFRYRVESTTLARVDGVVPAGNYTGPASATFFVGPFTDGDAASLVVFAEDAGGNTDESGVVEWRVDTSSPVTTLVDTPDAVTRRTGATFTLQCSEASCRFEYVFDGGPPTALGGNGTEGGVVDAVATLLDVAPSRVSNVSSPWVVFSVNASSPSLLVNATVGVVLGSREWTLGVEGNATQALQLPPMGDGTYVLSGVAESGSGVVDVTPVRYVFTVDTTPPTAAVTQAPGDGDAAATPLFIVDADEEGCEFQWRAGALPLHAPWQVSPSGVIRPRVAAGGVAHGFRVRAVDAAGNVGGEVGVDWTPAACPPHVPDVRILSSAGVGLGQRYVAFEGEGDVFEYRVDGGAWTETRESWVLLEGAALGAGHVVEVRAAVPGVCNGVLASTRPPARTAVWTEPAPLPLQVEVVDSPVAFTPNVFAEFVLAASRPLAWLEYSLDGEAWAPCEEVLVVGPLQAGGHTMRVRAVDGGGGGSGAVQSHTWTITAASDSSIVLSGLPDGEHTLTVVATDDAGSVEVAPKTFTWRVDSTPPVLGGNRTSPRFSTSRVAVVDVECTGEVDPCAFCWTSSTVGANCSAVSPVLLAAPDDGDHAADVRAVDSVGLASESGVEVVWTVDSTPPLVTVEDLDGVFVAPVFDTTQVDAVVGAVDVRLNVTADEAVSRVLVTLNGAVSPLPRSDAVVHLTDLSSIINTVVVAGVDLSGNVGDGTLLRLLVDVTPPDATAFTTTLPALTKESSVVVGVSSVDTVGGSGVRRVVVFVDGVEADTVEGGVGSVVVGGLGTGVYNVSAVGVDVAGNAGDTPVWWVVEVDQLPPVASFSVPPPPYVASPAMAVFVEANETADLFGRVVGVTDWLPANSSGGVVFTGLPDGGHVVEVRAVDAAGNNQTQPHAGVGVVVDTVRPVVRWASLPPVYTVEPVAVACFAVNDTSPVAGVRVEPVGALLTSPTCVEVVGVGDGRLGVDVTAVDAAGNVGEVLGAEWVLDRVPPEAVVDAAVEESGACVHVSGGATVCNAVGGAEVEVSCSDGGAGVEVSPCRVQYVVVLEEAAQDAACVAVGGRRLAAGFEDAPGGPFLLEGGGGDGLYAVAVRGVDEAGNVEAGNVTMRWYVDTVAPVRPTFVQQPDGVVSTTSVLFVVVLEGDNSPGQAVFWYKRDDGVGSAVDDLPVDAGDDVQLELSGLSPGSHKVEVWAVDQGGNVGPSVLHNWEVVMEAPGVVIVEQPAAVSGDVTPSFVFAARWAGNVSEPSAGVEVSLNGAAEYVEVCADTAESGGVCVWNASLAETGVGAYTINVRARLAGNVGNPTPFAWQYTVCGDDAFAELGDDGGISCLECPVGGNCEGGLTQQAEIAAVQGFWAPEGSTGLRFYECPVEEACLPGGEVAVGNETVRVVGQCAEGYKGTLCGVCEDEFFEQFGLCVSCGAGSGVAWVIMFAVAVAVIGVGVLFFKLRELMPIDQLKVTLSMVQIIASANTAYDIPWPPLFADFLNTMRVFLIEAVSLTRANCAQPMTFYGSLTVTLVGFKVVLAVVVLGPVVWHKCKRGVGGGGGGGMAALQPRPQGQPVVAGGRQRRRSSVVQAVVAGAHLVQAVDWAKVFKITFLFLFVAYPGVSLKIMTIFKCVEVEGDFWLVADMRLKCYEGEWYGYALYAFVMACLYTGGLPLAITVILWRNRGKLGEEGVVRKWGFLYESYGVGAYLWEVEELVRKLWLSALVVLMAEGSPLQVTVAVLISGWAHVLHAVYKPWRGVGEGGSLVYALQHGGLLVTFFVFLMGLLFKVEGVSQDGGTYNALAWMMLLACVGFLIAAGLVLVMAGMAQLRAVRRQQVVSGVKDTRTESASPQRVGATPRAARASHLGAQRLSWVGNPLRKAGDAKGSV